MATVTANAVDGKVDGRTARKNRKQFPVPDGGFVAWPENFDPKQHKPLKETDFAKPAVFMLHRAAKLEAKAANLRKEAAFIETLAGVQNVAKARQVIKLTEKLAEMKAKLASSSDIDLDALLASLNA